MLVFVLVLRVMAVVMVVVVAVAVTTVALAVVVDMIAAALLRSTLLASRSAPVVHLGQVSWTAASVASWCPSQCRHRHHSEDARSPYSLGAWPESTTVRLVCAVAAVGAQLPRSVRSCRGRCAARSCLSLTDEGEGLG